MYIDPYADQELHLDQCPCSGDLGLKCLQPRRYLVQLRLGELRQSPARVRTGERDAASAQREHQCLNRRCRCPGWRVVYPGPRTLKRKIFVAQAPSAQDFCILALASSWKLAAKLTEPRWT
jgi:hypothetical protein